VRQAGAAAVGVVVAAVGALVVGEYSLGVLAGIVAGVVLGFAVAEAALMTLGYRSVDTRFSVVLAFAAFGAMVWAGWIDVHHRNESIGAGAWLGAVGAALTVAVRTRIGTARSAGSGNPEDSRRTR
jgi:drug/metabolite transporter (DMT)-like permease